MNPEALMINLLPWLMTPLSDPANITITQQSSRPSGHIQVKRFAQPIEKGIEYMGAAKASTIYILKSLVDKPLATAEVQFKIQQNIDGTLSFG